MTTTELTGETSSESIDESLVIEKVLLDNEEGTLMLVADQAIGVITKNGTGNLEIADQAFIELKVGVIKYINQGAQYKFTNGEGLEVWIVAA